MALLLAVAALASQAATGEQAARTSAAPLPRVYLQPLASRLDWPDGSRSLRVRLSGLDHQGSITSDADRDTVPDSKLPSVGLGGFELVLHVDPAVARVSDFDESSFIESTGRNPLCFQHTEPGEYALVCATTGSDDGPQGSAVLGTLTLEPVANGASFLVLEARLTGPLGDAIPVTVDGGIVQVIGAPETAPTPPPGSPLNSGGPNSPSFGGGNPGSGGGVDDPTGGADGATGNGTGPEAGPGADGDGGGPDAEGAPTAGTGYQPEPSSWPATVGGLLAAAGASLLLLSLRLRARRR